MESRPVIPDRKLLARLVLVREEARNMMGGGILDERNDRGLNTLPEAEVCFLNVYDIHKYTQLKLVGLQGAHIVVNLFISFFIFYFFG